MPSYDNHYYNLTTTVAAATTNCHAVIVPYIHFLLFRCAVLNPTQHAPTVSSYELTSLWTGL
jgi:hypothetical protein